MSHFSFASAKVQRILELRKYFKEKIPLNRIFSHFCLSLPFFPFPTLFLFGIFIPYDMVAFTT